MKQYRIAVGGLAVTLCFVTLLLYYWHRVSKRDTENYIRKLIGSESQEIIHQNQEIVHGSEELIHVIKGPQPAPFRIVGTPMRHMPLDQIYEDGNKDDTAIEGGNFKPALLLNTPGCQIPIAMIPYKHLLKKEKRRKPGTCGKRAVFLKKIEGDKVKAVIKEKIVRTYLRKTALFECCYRFIMKSTRPGYENKKIQYTPCKKFKDGEVIVLESDFINVKCSEQRNNISREVYDDVFAFTRKINATNRPSTPCSRKYNVLMLGMDSMSLSHFVQVMERTVAFFHDNFWLGYSGYHKIGDNTLPNLMAVFTGQNFSTITQKCAGKMDECRDLFIWNKFKEIGYVTAYGEDYLRLPDTFHDEYELKRPPTDHYMRSLYIKGETELFNKSLVCAGKVPSAQHLLDYAVDFALTYRSESFFGVFWMNSYSHNVNSRPQDADHMLENFLNRLTYTGVFDNTFIILFSDHGIRFGEYRKQFESYYDERLPFLFIMAPLFFKGRHLHPFKSLATNQFKLITPYDLYSTLVDIHRISSCESLVDGEVASVSPGCPKCHSLFNDISPNRTCTDAAIHRKWCSCHKLFPLDITDAEASKSVRLIVTHIKTLSKNIKTKRCWGCVPLSLKKIIRIHFYFDDRKENLYHVIALSMTPGNMSYEVTVLRQGEAAEVVGSVSVISPYRGLGRCTNNPKDRLFCICQKVENCNKK